MYSHRWPLQSRHTNRRNYNTCTLNVTFLPQPLTLQRAGALASTVAAKPSSWAKRRTRLYGDVFWSKWVDVKWLTAWTSQCNNELNSVDWLKTLDKGHKFVGIILLLSMTITNVVVNSGKATIQLVGRRTRWQSENVLKNYQCGTLTGHIVSQLALLPMPC